jgi:hypothetical protein
MMFVCDAYKSIRDCWLAMTTILPNSVPQLSNEFTPVGGSMAGFMHTKEGMKGDLACRQGLQAQQCMLQINCYI